MSNAARRDAPHGNYVTPHASRGLAPGKRAARMTFRLPGALLCSLLCAVSVEAGQGPMISRDADGSATLRAVRLAEPLRIDGRLDEAIYADVQPISDFVQIEPQEGSPATER